MNAGEDSDHVAIDHADGFAEGNRGHRARGVGADAGIFQKLGESSREAALFMELPGGFVEIARTRVVAEPGPRGDNVALSGLSQGREVRKALEKSLIKRNDRRRRRLLQHGFRNPHAIGVAILPPRQGPLILSIPFQKMLLRLFEGHGKVLA